jgi:WD40 repeat protein
MRVILTVVLSAGLALAQTDLIGFNPSSRITVPSKVEAVAFSADGTLVAVAGKAGAYICGARGTGVTRFANGAIHAVAVARDGSKVAAGSESGEIILAGPGGGSLAQFRPHRGAVLSAGFSPDGSRLVTSGVDKNVIVSDASNGRELTRLTNPTGKAFVFAGFSAHNNSVVGASESGLIVEWDPAAGKVVRQTQDSDTTVFAAALNGAGTLLAISTEFSKLNKAAIMRQANPSDFFRKERLAIYDLLQGKMVKEIDGVDGQHRSLSFSADSRYLSAGREKVRGSFVSVYDVQRGVEVVSTPAQNGTLASAFSPDGLWFTQVDPQGALTIFSVTGVQRGTDVGDLAGRKFQITSKDTSPLLTPSQPIRLAVMDLDANGADASLGRAVSDQIINRISGSRNIDVIERRAMAQVMAEQNFQMSDRIDPLTAVSFGRVLGVQKMILGSVDKEGTTIRITVKVVDVQTLKTDGVREVECQRCALEDIGGAVAVLRTALVKE